MHLFHQLQQRNPFKSKVQKAHILYILSILQLPSSQQTSFNMPEVIVPHGEGDLLIYPSNLTHGYESNPSDQRITLSFNVAPV